MTHSDGKPSSRNNGTDRRRHFNPADDEKYRQHLAIQAYYYAAERSFAGDGATGDWPKAPAQIDAKAGSTKARSGTTLEDFKKFIEKRGLETGGWRKEVDRGQVQGKARSPGTGRA